MQNIHAIRDGVVPRFLNHCFKKCDALIVPTEKMYHYVKDGGFSDKINMKIIPTGIDFSELKAQDAVSPADTKKELGLPEDAKIILFLGRISAEKNLDELLDHFAAYTKHHDNIYLVTVGDGPYKETLVKRVKKLGIEDRVIVHDGVKHTDIRSFYDAADVFASASESETQGLTFYEALYCGVPVLAKDRECLEGAVTDGVNGAFFEDEASFAEALERILPVKEQNIGKPAATLPKAFESEQFAKDVAALYEEAWNFHTQRKKTSFERLADNGRSLGKKLRFKITKK